MTRREKCKSGFSLIEINLAIFVVGLGMLTLFSLFPTGLRQVEDSQNDTQMALFADYVFSTLRSRSREVSAAQWGPAAFDGVIESELPGARADPVDRAISRAPWGGGTEPQYMRYRIEFGGTNRVVTATLWCQVGEYGPSLSTFKNRAGRFYTEFAYSGMP